MYQDYQQDYSNLTFGVESHRYGDGSFSFDYWKPNAVRGLSFNQRLNSLSRIGQSCWGSRRNFIVTKDGTCVSMKYPVAFFLSRGDRPEFDHLIMNSDLERNHLPQAWMTGRLPILTREYYDRFIATKDVNWLRFNVPKVPTPEALACVESYLWLILHGWSGCSLRLQDLTRLLRKLGFSFLTSDQVRDCLRSLDSKGMIRTFYRYRVILYSGRYPENWIHWGRPEHLNFFNNIWNGFVPFLVRSKS